MTRRVQGVQNGRHIGDHLVPLSLFYSGGNGGPKRGCSLPQTTQKLSRVSITCLVRNSQLEPKAGKGMETMATSRCSACAGHDLSVSQFPHLVMEIVALLGGLNETIVGRSHRASAVTAHAAGWWSAARCGLEPGCSDGWGPAPPVNNLGVTLITFIIPKFLVFPAASQPLGVHRISQRR